MAFNDKGAIEMKGTADFSVASQNTAIITSKDGTSIYVMGVSDKGIVSDNASFQVSIKQGGQTYLISGGVAKDTDLSKVVKDASSKDILEGLGTSNVSVIGTKTLANGVQIITSFAGWEDEDKGIAK